jgi:hypothetical protein
MLGQDRTDSWWTLDAGGGSLSGDVSIAEEINNLIARYALPFLDRFHKVDDVIIYLRGPRNENEQSVMPMHRSVALTYVGIIYYLRGQGDECCAALEEAAALALKKPNDVDLQDIKARLCGD